MTSAVSTTPKNTPTTISYTEPNPGIEPGLPPYKSGYVPSFGLEPCLDAIPGPPAFHGGRARSTPHSVWMVGLEPTTSRFRTARADQAALHPVVETSRRIFDGP